MAGTDLQGSDRVRRAIRESSVMRSGLVTVLVVAILLAGSMWIWFEHTKGNIHKMRSIAYVPAKATAVRPGGMEAITLQRSVLSIETPEFLLATFAPGRPGLQFLSSRVSVPGTGEFTILRGTGNDSDDRPTDNSSGFPLVETVAAREKVGWGTPFSMLNRQPDRSEQPVMPDGGSIEEVFDGNSPDIPASLRDVMTKVTVTFNGRAIDMVVVAKNNAQEPRGVELRWEPHFLVASPNVTLTPPQTEGSVTTAAQRADLLDKTYTRLKRSYLAGDPEVVLRDREHGFSLHVIASSPSIQSLRVLSDRSSKDVMLAFSTAKNDDGQERLALLRPGESLQFHVRVLIESAGN